MTTTVLAYISSPSQGVWLLFGRVPIRAYALCIIAGIVAALVLGDRRWTARGGEKGVIYDIALWPVLFGLIGGRLYHVMTDWPKYFGADGAGFLAALRIYDGGLGIWGAVALGGVGAWIACHRRGIPLPAFGDAIAPGIILAQAIGRFGNYFNQELYGRATDLPWGLTIYERLDPSGVISPHSLDGVSTGQVYAVVHPTFLYELLWNLLIFAMLLWVDRRFKIGHGRLFALYVAGYCVGRFWVELMRSDTATLIAGIRVNTFTSMFVFIAAVIYIMVAPKGREDPRTLRGNDRDRESLLDELGEELTTVAATSGVVAAAKAAGDEPPATSTAPEDAEATPEDAGATTEVPAIALEGTEVADALNAEVETPSEVAPEDGLGSVDGDEVKQAEESAAEVHEIAADGAVEAESVADDVAVEPDDTPTDAAGEDAVGGVGAVDGEDAVAAEESAAEVHEVAADGAAEAEGVADDVAAEPDDTPTDAAGEDAVGGVGAVDGEDAVAAEESAAEVHKIAADGAAEAEGVADDVAAEPDDTEGAADDVAAEPDDTPTGTAGEDAVGGLGAVDGADAVAAEESAAEVHEIAADGAAEAEGVAEDVAAEPDDTEGAADDVAAEPDDTPTDAAGEDAVGGLGAVDGADAVAAEESAAQVHEIAINGAAEAESVAEDVAAEPGDTPTDAAGEDAVGGVGAVDGEDAVAAEESAAEVHEVAIDGAAEAESVAEDVAAEPDDIPTETADDAETTAKDVAADESAVTKAPDAQQSRRPWWRRG